MQLLSIVVWGWNDPTPRVLSLRPGRLNVITGDSKTGKSALLDIVDYCFGRDEEPVAGDRIRQAVSWYGVQMLIGQTHIFIGRPRTAPGASRNSQAVLLETTTQQLPDRGSLTANTDVSGLRRRLDELLGIGEYTALRDEAALAPGTSASVGTAIVLCLQKQGTVSDRETLFHRQGEKRVAEALGETLPYFLGAEPWDQAVRQARLRNARRAADAAQNRLRILESRDAAVDADLRALVEEAYGVGLLESNLVVSREQAIADLRVAATRPLTAPSARQDETGTERQPELRERLTRLRQELRGLIEERAALLALAADEDAYTGALTRQHTALRSLDLLGASSEEDGEHCPLCGQSLPEPDPTVEQMQAFARELQAELTGLEGSAPRRAGAVARVEARVSELREQIPALEAAVAELRALAGEAVDTTRGEEIAFRRGRIHASLATMDQSTQNSLEQARRAAVAARQVLQQLANLAEENDSDLESRLLEVSQYLTGYATLLDVEHSDRPVSLDVRRLTTVMIAASGRLRLREVGSAANYLGLHVATHLALHRFFVDNDRPVPRFLMLDQPSQPFYPEDVPDAKDAEVPTRSSDRDAVVNLYRLLHDFADSQGGNFQIIVSDHVNLRDEDWFQGDVVEIWRDGRALIPDHWQARPT